LLLGEVEGFEEYFTPLLQINFLPDLMQVYFNPFKTLVAFTFEHDLPGLISAPTALELKRSASNEVKIQIFVTERRKIIFL
jgi:hypothetical protein